MRKSAAAALTTSAAVASGIDLAGQVGATAAEMLRTRRDPAVIARRKRRAAKRRLKVWSGGVIGSGAATAVVAVTVVPGGLSAGAVLALIFLAALLVYCVVGAVRAAAELKARTRAVAALPPPSPARRAVAAEIRPEMARLDGYSDGLRHLVGMIGIVDDDPGVRAMRDETLSAADASEARLRQRAVDLSGLLKARRAAPPGSTEQLDAAADLLRRQLHDGVAGYGELVSAAGEAVAASRRLADQAGGSGVPALSAGTNAASVRDAQHHELEQQVDQLRSLAAGMRELTQG
jgi:hypothetical protein